MYVHKEKRNNNRIDCTINKQQCKKKKKDDVLLKLESS